MYMLIKIVQTRTLYLVEYTKARKMACLLLDNLYITPVEAFDGIDFTKWKELIDLQNPQNILKLDENNCVCISVRDNLVPLHILQKHGRTIKEKPVTRDEFQVVIQEVKSNLTNVARVLTTEIRERFPRDELLEAMSIVYPQFWNHTLDKEVFFSF